ncbi:Holliday junction branch migration protein RuvA [Candidatus Gottesmanbacteria bacterium]|nr:Holliday junction branch migration protein RuvA [Candidatus Gottesmanbacteria bacterium]
MIGLLKGQIYSKYKNSIILMVGGVGYAVTLGETLASRSVLNEERIFHVYTHVKEDALDLFGFETLEQKQLFEILLSISGIGPKTALAISDKGLRSITSAVKKSDVGFFTSIPRLGKKNAQKIIIELKSKLKDSVDFMFEEESEETTSILSALMSMGFDKKEIQQVLTKIDTTLTLEDKIRHSLKLLGK